jgi:hypothetical protein
VALAAITAASCNAQQQLLSQPGFRDEVMHQISAQHPELCVRAHGDSGIEFGRSAQKCDEAQVSTAYTYGQYIADPAHQGQFVALLVGEAQSAVAALDGAPFSPDRSNIVALLRPREYAMNAGPQNEMTSSIWRPFAGDFIVLLAQNKDGQARGIRGIDLQTIGLSNDEAWHLALANLRRQIGSLTRTPNASGAEVVTAESGLATSWLLLPETCVSGGVSFDVYVVQRDTFFYADTAKPEATAMLASYAAQLLQGEQVYSHRLLSCLDGRWYGSVLQGTAWVPEQEAH